MYEYMRRFGFNRKPPIDLPSDELRSSGVYDDGKLLDDADDVDIGRVAIGQERLLVTPLQMAMVASAIGERRQADAAAPRRAGARPRRADGDERKPAASESEVMKPSTARALAAMMSQVVEGGNRNRGRALGHRRRRARPVPPRSAERTRPGSSAFAPVERPRVAIAVTVERTTGQGGTVAAPIAKQVMETLLR